MHSCIFYQMSFTNDHKKCSLWRIAIGFTQGLEQQGKERDRRQNWIQSCARYLLENKKRGVLESGEMLISLQLESEGAAFA